VALLRAQEALAGLKLGDERDSGVLLIRRAVEEPLKQIAKNAGREGSVVVAAVKAGKGAFGFNAATETFEDLMAAGVIDPTKVVRMALENAASVAGLMLTTEALIADKPKPPAPAERPAGLGGPGGMGGMGGMGGGDFGGGLRHGQARRLFDRGWTVPVDFPTWDENLLAGAGKASGWTFVSSGATAAKLQNTGRAPSSSTTS
jgi:hypothetical protein